MANGNAYAFLILDDDQGDAFMLKSLLESVSGYTVTCSICTDLNSCKETLQAKKIDLVFLSYRFDARNGFEFLKALRKANKDLQIVILTSRGDEHITAEIIRGGANDYLAKSELSSLRIRRLVEKVAAGISQQREKKREETILRLNEQNYRKLVDNIPDVVFVHRDGNVLFVNQSAQAVLGYTEQELIGKSVFEFVPEEQDRNTIIANMKKRAADEDVPDYEIRLRDKKGAVRTVLVRATKTMFNDEPAFQVVLIDITERKRAEEEVLKTRKLESLGILAGGIAHDFNNALTGITSGIAAAKMKTETSGELYEILDEIEAAAFKASELTQELLTFSQGGEPMREPSSIAQCIKDAIKTYPQNASISYTTELPDNLLSVVIDKNQIGQVFTNLFLNAAQAMSSSGEIAVRASNASYGETRNTKDIEAPRIDDIVPLHEGLYVKIEVSDTGMGIPEANIEKIFDPYFTTKSGGTGLGLAAVYSIIQKHDGHIAVESEVGKGTMFTIYLPATLKAQQMQSDSREVEKEHPPKILVMDDDATIQFTLGRFLRGIGYSVICAPDGDTAIQQYKEALNSGERISAVLLDLSIPGGRGGKDTMVELQKIDPGVKAIVISGYSDDGILANYKEHGFCGVMKKPFRPELLGAMLKEITGT